MNTKTFEQLKIKARENKIVRDYLDYGLLPESKLFGVFNTEEDEGDFILDLNQAREDRAVEIINKDK